MAEVRRRILDECRSAPAASGFRLLLLWATEDGRPPKTSQLRIGCCTWASPTEGTGSPGAGYTRAMLSNRAW